MVTTQVHYLHSTSWGALTGLYPTVVTSISMVCGFDYWGRYTVVVSCITGKYYHDIALATGQYHIYYIALAVPLIYVIGAWDTNIYMHRRACMSDPLLKQEH